MTVTAPNTSQNLIMRPQWSMHKKEDGSMSVQKTVYVSVKLTKILDTLYVIEMYPISIVHFLLLVYIWPYFDV